MSKFYIIGESKPNKVKLKSTISHSVTELPKSTVRRMIESEIISVSNPELVYHTI
ncbi:MAG: hypothetical protein P1U56_04880 [Saprospiraceae bacterium]|nr:hypothetical protein [Saprospiraceae bacterium]